MDNYKNEIRDHVVAAYETVCDELRTWRQFITEAWPLIALLLIGIAIAVWLSKPAPPKYIQMATGSEGGSYEILAKKYADFFALHGVTIELVKTSGAEENITRLKDPKDPLQAAFVQSGLIDEKLAEGLMSLGSVGYEPIWFFYRNDLVTVERIHADDFLKDPIAIGEPGSGTYQQVMNLIKINEFKETSGLRPISNAEGVKAFQEGRVNSIVLIDGMESKNVQTLLNDPKASLADFTRAAAYTRLLPYYHSLTIPQGALNLARNEPRRNLDMIAATTNLVIDKRLHPAIQLLFLQAAEKINGGRSFFSKYGEFPAYKDSVIPESDVAKSYFQKGAPTLLEYLPFWLAEFFDRLLILLLPLFAFGYPIIKSMPSYRLNRAKTRINDVYLELKRFEQELRNDFDYEQTKDYLDKIAELDDRAATLRVPRSLVSDYFSLRSSIDFVRTMIVTKSSQRGETTA
jgi:TRAP-type uncharacterized transport system substrate-binding protein